MYLFSMLFVITIPTTNPKQTDVTLNVHERVRLLKEEFVNEMQIARQGPVNPVADDFPDYVYEDDDVQPITPISNDDERKKKHRFMLRQFKTTRDSEIPQFKVQTESSIHKKARDMKEKRRRKKKLTSKPVDIFYRRHYDFSFMENQACWIHCQDLITPFLTGQKKNLTRAKRVVVKDPIVTRLVQLITLNTTGSSKDDIYSILYQISNLQIRLFQWDVSSIMFLYKGLLKNEQPSFKTLKQALKERFKTWSLDITNTTNLLKQARIFRPPCVQITGFDGSTKNPRSTFYTMPTTKKCADDDDDEECQGNQ